jgi:hypothetical protein
MDVVESDASTTGSTSTLLDQNFPKRDYAGAIPADDFYNGGTIWLIDCTSTGMNNTTHIISDFESSTATFTYDASTAATVSGDQYAVCEAIWPRYKLRQWVGLAMQSIMKDPALDVTLTTSIDTETLTLPTGVYNVQSIEIATSLTSPYYYSRFPDGYWEEKNGYIYFKPGRWPDSSSYKVRLWYQLPNNVSDYVTSDATTISNYIHPQWLAWEAAVHAYRWRKPLDESGKVDGDRFKEALAMASMMRNRYSSMLPKLRWDVKLANWNQVESSDPTYTGYVRLKS